MENKPVSGPSGSFSTKRYRDQEDGDCQPTAYKKNKIGATGNSIAVRTANSRVENSRVENSRVANSRSRSVKEAEKSSDLAMFFRTLDFKERKYHSTFSPAQKNLLGQSFNQFLSLISDSDNIELMNRILNQKKDEIENRPDDIRLLLELSLCVNIIVGNTNINSFIFNFRLFLNDTLHITKDNAWFKSIKDLLLKVGATKTNLTHEHIYKAIYATYNISNQQEALAGNNLTLDGNTQISDQTEANIVAEAFKFTEAFIEKEVSILNKIDVQRTSSEMAAALSKKFLCIDKDLKTAIMKELVSFFTKPQENLENKLYLEQFYLRLLCRMANEDFCDGKSLDEICDRISNMLFICKVEFTKEQIKSILGVYADPKKSKHIDTERLIIGNLLEVIFADRPL